MRLSLQSLDDTGGAFTGGGPTPPFGILDRQHLPLRFLREHHPEIYSLFDTYHSFALARDVESRFRSSLNQYSRIHLGVPFGELEFTAQAELVAKLVTDIPDGVAELDYRFAHFIPQVDFVELDGVAVVRDVVHVNDFDRFAKALAARYPMAESSKGSGRRNRTVVHRSGMTRMVGSGLRALAPEALRARVPRRLRARVRQLLYRRPSQADVYPGLTADLEPFLRSFYAADHELVARTRRSSFGTG